LAAKRHRRNFYAANCTDDSALFVITWYFDRDPDRHHSGYLIGRMLLRWKTIRKEAQIELVHLLSCLFRRRRIPTMMPHRPCRISAPRDRGRAGAWHARARCRNYRREVSLSSCSCLPDRRSQRLKRGGDWRECEAAFFPPEDHTGVRVDQLHTLRAQLENSRLGRWCGQGRA